MGYKLRNHLYITKELMKNGVAVVYGSSFGEGFGDYARISFSTTPVKLIEDGVKRIKETLSRYSVYSEEKQ